ncbi:unnamed protein product [Amoebophrya sp. A25]|nr:unnamed protein product [Amoebophrya sp. A25]|eukprot:GSA25T00005851001.1
MALEIEQKFDYVISFKIVRVPDNSFSSSRTSYALAAAKGKVLQLVMDNAESQLTKSGCRSTIHAIVDAAALQNESAKFDEFQLKALATLAIRNFTTRSNQEASMIRGVGVGSGKSGWTIDEPLLQDDIVRAAIIVEALQKSETETVTRNKSIRIPENKATTYFFEQDQEYQALLVITGNCVTAIKVIPAEFNADQVITATHMKYNVRRKPAEDSSTGSEIPIAIQLDSSESEADESNLHGESGHGTNLGISTLMDGKIATYKTIKPNENQWTTCLSRSIVAELQYLVPPEIRQEDIQEVASRATKILEQQRGEAATTSIQNQALKTMLSEQFLQGYAHPRYIQCGATIFSLQLQSSKR